MRSLVWIVMVSLCASAQVVDAQSVSPRSGERIRVWLKNPQAHHPEFRLLMPKTKHFEAEFHWMTSDSIAFETDSRVLRIAYIPIGHWKTVEIFALAEVQRLEVRRTPPFQRPGRKKVALAVLAGIGSGVLLFNTGESKCGQKQKPCSKAADIAGNVATGALVGGLVIMVGNTERWEPIPLPTAPDDAGAH